MAGVVGARGEQLGGIVRINGLYSGVWFGPAGEAGILASIQVSRDGLHRGGDGLCGRRLKLGASKFLLVTGTAAGRWCGAGWLGSKPIRVGRPHRTGGDSMLECR